MRSSITDMRKVSRFGIRSQILTWEVPNVPATQVIILRDLVHNQEPLMPTSKYSFIHFLEWSDGWLMGGLKLSPTLLFRFSLERVYLKTINWLIKYFLISRILIHKHIYRVAFAYKSPFQTLVDAENMVLLSRSSQLAKEKRCYDIYSLSGCWQQSRNLWLICTVNLMHRICSDCTRNICDF
jgi:hypothetical protein